MSNRFYRFEKKHDSLLSTGRFAWRLGTFVGFGVIIQISVIILGAVGFHYTEQLSWIDSMLNATMVMTGNGPAFVAHTVGARVFQMVFSLCGVISFILVLSVIAVPVIHRVLHHFHIASVETVIQDEDSLK